jgi:uroporphyrin-III C-methyltransferase
MSDPLDPVPPTDAADAGAQAPSGVGEVNSAGPRAKPPPARAHVGSRVWLAVVAVLALAVGVAAWVDGRRTQRDLRVEVAQRLAAVETTTQVTGKSLTDLATEMRDAQARTTLLETRIAESQAQQAALEALYRDLAPSRDEIALSEIEQVLLVASQQLQLAGNVPSALTALQLADAKLQRLDRPQFVPLRRSLSRDMDQLKAVPFVDVTGLGLKLDQSIAAVGTLPLAMDERLPPPVAEGTPVANDAAWQRLLRDLWGDVKQLVRIEVSDRPSAPLLLPSQQYFLRENLRLRLLSARLALLNHDDASFKADIAAAATWVGQYFDTRTKPVQTLQATLKQLASTQLAGEMPDLSRSLEALRVLRLSQDRAPGRPAGPPPAR